MLRSGARWQDVPREQGSPTTCWRRLKEWQDLGVWEQLRRAILACLQADQELDWAQASLDGSFVPANRDASGQRPERRGEDGWHHAGDDPHPAAGGPAPLSSLGTPSGHSCVIRRVRAVAMRSMCWTSAGVGQAFAVRRGLVRRRIEESPSSIGQGAG